MLSLRALDPSRDLNQVADLIELCFADTMDADGRDYVAYLRQEARYGGRRWKTNLSTGQADDSRGFVWVEGDQIIGNLSLIRIPRKSGDYFLIANVATHPNFRGRGIGRALTERAIQSVREQKNCGLWLHVRADNPIAHRLYGSLGFVERAWRTTWLFSGYEVPATADVGYTVGERRRNHWRAQQCWLQRSYPGEVRWNLPLEPELMKPTLWNDLVQFFADKPYVHWTVREGKNLWGLATWQFTSSHSDYLWLACHPQAPDQAVKTLLTYAALHKPSLKAVQVNYPAGEAGAAFEQAGFHEHNTLIWMEYGFLPKN